MKSVVLSFSPPAIALPLCKLKDNLTFFCPLYSCFANNLDVKKKKNWFVFALRTAPSSSGCLALSVLSGCCDKTAIREEPKSLWANLDGE